VQGFCTGIYGEILKPYLFVECAMLFANTPTFSPIGQIFGFDPAVAFKSKLNP